MKRHLVAIIALMVANAAIAAGTLAAMITSPASAPAYGATQASPSPGSTPVLLPTTGPGGAPKGTPAAVPETIYRAGGVGDFPFANPFAGVGRIETLWTRTDLPVKQGMVSRTWLWGPGPNTPGMLEQYDDAPDGSGLRLVQYFDKSRMEINDPHGNWNSDFYVTNGLLTIELVSGAIQVAQDRFLPYRSACIPVTGDPNDLSAPTYAALESVASTPFGDHPASNLLGRHAIQVIDHAGTVSEDSRMGQIEGTEFVYFEGKTRHNIPQVFWEFLNSTTDVYEEEPNEFNQIVNRPGLSTGRLSTPWFYATGLPISEPYWTRTVIRGDETMVLLQAYERRVLTYVPGNPDGFTVEMGNIGQHYFDWRYADGGVCPGSPPTTPMPVVPAPTGTIPAVTPTWGYSTPTEVPTWMGTPATTTPLPVPTGTITPLP